MRFAKNLVTLKATYALKFFIGYPKSNIYKVPIEHIEGVGNCKILDLNEKGQWLDILPLDGFDR